MIIIYKGVKVYSSKDSIFFPIGSYVYISYQYWRRCPKSAIPTVFLTCAERSSLLYYALDQE